MPCAGWLRGAGTQKGKLRETGGQTTAAVGNTSSSSLSVMEHPEFRTVPATVNSLIPGPRSPKHSSKEPRPQKCLVFVQKLQMDTHTLQNQERSAVVHHQTLNP
jgi:hypothetical protein